MSTLPQPPAPSQTVLPDGTDAGTSGADRHATEVHRRPAGAGELTPAWRTTFIIAWIGVVLSYAAVWKSARTMGLSTWWLGPPADPRWLIVQLLPFIGPVALVVAASRHVRFLPYWGLLVALGGFAIAAGDLDRFNRLALVELAVAAAGALVSLASFAGLLRSEPESDHAST